MAATLEETSVSYEDLNDLSGEFDDVDTELIRQEVQLKRSLYEKRQKLVSQIPNFWPLVLEQAPPDIDEYIQPSDSALLLSSLVSLSVSHFEIENGAQGDPRSVSITWEFSDNDYFEDKKIEKKFWHRHTEDGWAGLVSEPVEIQWKKGKDLTDGLLGMVKKVWEEDQTLRKQNNGVLPKREGLTPDQKSLKKKMENTGLGGLSFFAWFGYIGKDVSAEESRLAVEKQQRRRKLRQQGEQDDANGKDHDDEKDGEDDDDEYDLELFPEGENLAIAISEDLWPGAIKYFTQAQEQDALSDEDFEEEEDDDPEDLPDAADGEEPPSKKRKA